MVVVSRLLLLRHKWCLKLLISWLRDWLRARRTGFIAQEKDERDRPYNISGSSELLRSIDLRKYFLTARNQANAEACTGFAVAGLVEYYLNHDLKLRRKVSPLHLWIRGKEYHGWADDNKGVWLRYSLKGLFEHGFVYEFNFPFNNDYLRPLTRQKVYIVEDVTKFYLEHLEYTLLRSDQVRDALAKKRPVVFGIKINKSFYGNKTGIIEDITPSNYSHAMLVVGYDDDNQCFIVRNSWGAGWGDNGYCYIPYDYFDKNTNDIWTIDYKEG